MKDLLTRLSSRKFLLTVLAVITAFSVAIQDGTITAAEVWTILTPILAYLGVEGAGDVAARYSAKNQ